MIRLSLLTCAILLASALPAHAQMRGGGQIFDNADSNKDGMITRDEYLAARAQNFSKLDRNGDGFIDDGDKPKLRRARAQGGERVAELREQFDKDGDGRISRAEFTNGPTLAFDRADANHDGRLDADEIAAAKEAIKRAAEAARSR